MMASDLVARIFPHFQDTFAVQMLVERMRLHILHLVLLGLPNADLEAFYQPCSAPLASPYCDKKFEVTWKSKLSSSFLDIDRLDKSYKSYLAPYG